MPVICFPATQGLLHLIILPYPIKGPNISPSSHPAYPQALLFSLKPGPVTRRHLCKVRASNAEMTTAQTPRNSGHSVF